VGLAAEVGASEVGPAGELGELEVGPAGELGELEVGFAGDGYTVIFNEPVAYPISFECKVCDLELNEAELEAAGMPPQVDLFESDDV
jgi:hypothetical protein